MCRHRGTQHTDTTYLYVFKLKDGLWQNVKYNYLYTLRKKIKPRTCILICFPLPRARGWGIL